MSAETVESTNFINAAMNDDLVRDRVGSLLEISLVDRGIISAEAVDGYLDILGDDEASLERRAEMIRQHVIDANNPNSEYSTVYARYSSETRTAYRASLVTPFLEGAGVVLDLGTGNGRLAMEVVRSGEIQQVIATDVHDYRTQEVKDHPQVEFMQTDSIDHLPEGSVDGVFCSLALHHVETGKVSPLLHEIGRVLRRGGAFIVLEETPPLKDGQPLTSNKSTTDLDQAFEGLAVAQQKQVLGVMDYVSNWVGNGVYDVPLPFQFHTAGEWLSLFDNANLLTESVDYYGIPSMREKFTPVPSTRFVLRK